MFIITAKLDKRKLIAGLFALVAAAALAALLFTGGSGSEAASALSTVVKNNSQRVAYLESLGWQVSDQPLEEQKVTVPRSFSEVYTEYNELQKEQGFDLTKYAGLEAVRYTYEVKNHPTAAGQVVADMIVYRNRVIAADIQSVNAGAGFMNGIKFPGA